MELVIVFTISTLTFLLGVVILTNLLSVHKKLNKFTYNHLSWDGIFSLVLSNGDKVLINKDTDYISGLSIPTDDRNTKIAGITLHDVPEGKIPRIQMNPKARERQEVIITTNSSIYSNDLTYVLRIPQDFLRIIFYSDAPVSKYSILTKWCSFDPKRSLYTYTLTVSVNLDKN